MAVVWLGRFERWLEKYFNAKGGGVVLDIEPSVRCVISLPIGNEDRYLQSWNRFISAPTVNALAANSGGARLRNPAGSNVIAVIEKLEFHPNVASASTFKIQMGTATSDLTTSGSGFRQDPRGNPNSSSISSVQTATPANLSTTIGEVICSQTGATYPYIVTVDQELTLLPGDALQVVDQTVNEQFFMFWMWRERALESSELT